MVDGRPAATARTSTAASTLRCAPLVLTADAIRLQASIERAAAETELRGGGAHVAGVPRQGLLDHDALRVFQRLLGRSLCRRTEREVARPHGGRAGIGKEHRALDRMSQLAHVARP